MFKINFPVRQADLVVETSLMERTANRTMAVHPAGALVVWAGQSRVGKTWTARWFRDAINAAYGTDPNAFRAVHYEVGRVEDSATAMKKGIRSLYHATISPITASAYRASSEDDLARQLVYGLQARNIQMVFIDEAGLLDLDAIRGMVLVRDTAENEGHPLTLVFIGMDDLPTTMRRLPQIENRIHEWCYFEAYSSKEIWDLAAALHPHFARLDVASPEGVGQAAYLFDITGGLPGKLGPFLRKLSLREVDAEDGIDLAFLKAVHLMTVRDRQRTVDDADGRRGDAAQLHRGGPAAKAGAESGAKGKRRAPQKRPVDPPRTGRGKRPRRSPDSSKTE